MTILQFGRGSVVNLFVLLGCVTLYALLRGWSEKQRHPVAAWQLGLLFGGMALVSMFVPVVVEPGFIFDCRAGVIGAGALIGGPITALISMPPPIIYRLCLGGEGTVPGILEVVFPALFGSLCHLWFHRRQHTPTLWRIVSYSAFTGLASNCAVLGVIMLTSPASADVGSIGSIVLVFVYTPVAMALLTAMIVLERRHAHAIDAFADSERRMLHSQKMAAVGQLSRKVAHNFVNALTVLLGNAQLAKDSADDPELVVDMMDDIIETAGRTSVLVGELLAFSSPGTARMQRLDLSKSMASIRSILANAIGPDITVELDVADHVGRVEMDPDRMEQAIVHLAVNGAEAMANRGTLTVSMATATLPPRERERLQAGTLERDRHTGDFAVVSVHDTGCGMDDETVSRMFEPFFTTKEGHTNAGLGLASVYSIVRQHRGYLDVRSRPGHGTTVEIYLPVVGQGGNS